MKKLLVLVIVAVVLSFACSVIAEVEQKAQNCEVVFEVTYNSIPLDKAADVELLMKKRFKDACKVKIKSVKPRDEDINVEVSDWVISN